MSGGGVRELHHAGDPDGIQAHARTGRHPWDRKHPDDPMASHFHPLDPETLRQHLMAPEPTKRAAALHALEVELEPGTPAARSPLAGAAAKFAARGIPFYAVDDPHYRAWVSKAVDFWLRLRATHSGPAAHA
jgi:hypothetical protein